MSIGGRCIAGLWNIMRKRILFYMKPNQPLTEKLNEVGSAPERGYDAWKRAKVEKGLEQSKDRDAMIPVSRILRDFGLER